MKLGFHHLNNNLRMILYRYIHVSRTFVNRNINTTGMIHGTKILVDCVILLCFFFSITLQERASKFC